jgi:hypothetical protein
MTPSHFRNIKILKKIFLKSLKQQQREKNKHQKAKEQT